MPFENRFNFVVFIVMLPVMGDPVHVNHVPSLINESPKTVMPLSL